MNAASQAVADLAPIPELEVGHIREIVSALIIRAGAIQRVLTNDEETAARIGSAYWIKQYGAREVKRRIAKIRDANDRRAYSLRLLRESIVYLDAQL